MTAFLEASIPVLLGCVALLALAWGAPLIKAGICRLFHQERSLLSRTVYGDNFKCRICGREWWDR